MRVLLVDDNEDAAELLASGLQMRGYTTRVAFDAESALRIAQEFAPQIAVLDIGLPITDGYQLAQQLLKLPGLEGMRLIALTGYGQDSDRARTREAGFHRHLAKPIKIASIVAALCD